MNRLLFLVLVCIALFPKRVVAQSVNGGALNENARISVLRSIVENMVAVEGGTFTMGTRFATGDERPTHEVTLSDFSICRYEVTQAEWEAVMGENPSENKGKNLPVENVSWEDCQKFISRLNSLTGKQFRLPTEAEWEYAARGGQKASKPEDDGVVPPADVLWYAENSDGETHPVGTKRANELGLFDLSGNVAEWCNDWYDNRFFTDEPQDNPKGPERGTYRVVRGGCFWNSAVMCRVVLRTGAMPTSRSRIVGLRLAM